MSVSETTTDAEFEEQGRHLPYHKTIRQARTDSVSDPPAPFCFRAAVIITAVEHAQESGKLIAGQLKYAVGDELRFAVPPP